MTITQARTTRRGKISIYVDGEFLFAVNASVWRASQLDEGCEVTQEQLQELLGDSNLAEAKRRALNMLSCRDYSGEQLISRIAPKTDAASARAAVERMEELGLIDDDRYALRCAEQLFDKGFGRRRIIHELQKRRLPESVISSALESLDFSDSEERAAALAAQKFGSLQSEADIRRAAAFLERHGYSYSDVGYAIRQNRASCED